MICCYGRMFCLNLSHFLKYLDDLVSLDQYLDDLLLLLFSKKIISLTLFILYNIIKISHHIIFFYYKTHINCYFEAILFLHEVIITDIIFIICLSRDMSILVKR